MINYKSYVTLTILALICVGLVLQAKAQLVSTISTSGVKLYLERTEFTGQSNSGTLMKTVDTLLPVLSESTAGGYEYELAGNLYNWLYFKDQSSENKEWSKHYYTMSTQYRPTWPNAYVELAKIAQVSNDQPALETNLKQALRFGPSYPATKLLYIDVVYSSWHLQSKNERIDASQQLLEFADDWKHRENLERMITHSKGKSRICNMLKFNRVKIKSCQV
ncbi:hypothetical protein AB4259_22055 [Vibrio amylolyticus]|uniref:hypothetical protein n=1 Tax=Vibrio amylolyticus TaxID=2847292 RepID=UPI003554357C